MRVRIDSVDLVGGGRRIEFLPGLNIIRGTITTGKTTLLRLTKLLISSSLDVSKLPREVREKVTAVAGTVAFGESTYSIVRPYVSTPTAKVDIAGPTTAWRLPASQPDATANLTYGQWLLRTLGLPDVRVPSAPSRTDSDTTPVTINDYMMYCDLPQDDIDKNVFSHDDPFKNIKRRYVFQLIYGLYNVDIALIHEEIRQVSADIRQIAAQTGAFERFLRGTPWENRSVLSRELQQAREALDMIQAEAVATASGRPPSPIANSLRDRLAELDAMRDSKVADLARERANVEQLARLLNQLETQTARLTRAIVAETYLLDFEFTICPRCATPVDVARANEGHCGLCLQVPQGERPDRGALIAEQDRLSSQIQETKELVSARQSAAERIEEEIGRLIKERENVSSQLDYEVRSFVSEAASQLSANAARRAGTEANVRRLEDYQSLYEKLDQALGDLATLDARRTELEARLELASGQNEGVEARIRYLERELETILDRFNAPRFTATRSVRIDRRTYLPIIDDRRFDELSSPGLQVLVNVAHALAHHRTSVALGLGLPQILLIDGPSSNLGHEGEDLDRVNRVYGYLVELSRDLGDQLQIVVADNDVPELASEFVRLDLADDDRLIRTATQSE